MSTTDQVRPSGPSYHGRVTNPPTAQPEDQHWQQPQFAPGPDPVTVAGTVIVPGEQAPPPSVAETVVGTLSGLVWPVMIALVIFTSLSFWPGLIIAVVASAVLRAVQQQLRSRRRAPFRQPPAALR